METATSTEGDAIAAGRRIYLGKQSSLRGKPYDIEELLTTNGFDQIDKIHISVDPLSARSPGYCFVDFLDRETADRALSSLSASIRGRLVKVGPCKPKTPRNYRSNDKATTIRRWGDWNTELEDGEIPIGRINSKDEKKGPSWALNHFDSAQNDKGQRLYVGGLHKMIDQDQHQHEIITLFEDFAPTAIGKRKTPHESTKSQPGGHHYCFVDFESKEEASEAMRALNGRAHRGSHLRVHVARAMAPKPMGSHVNERYSRRAWEESDQRPKRPRVEDEGEGERGLAPKNWRSRD